MTKSRATASADSSNLTLSLPEELQLALPPLTGHLRFGSMDIAVAAIIDLALRGRIVATKSRFGQPSDAKLTLVDASPTGNGPLDAVVQAFVARGKPWKAYPARLDRAPSLDDPMATVLLDIRHHSAEGWTRKPGQKKPPMLADYPENVGITARGTLSALYIASGSAV
ncbi:GPP34 family phosphoprotein [Cryobacterium sp.]|uniref:GPP34 family phosphoprotein n=1 Tax=Cryobacterium sp. TaxID=1926290 RepID=UPI002620B119|nr:GPP34 family phosphoprotein [Cryobacterium sp.]MCU1447443.1 hypothetical protein [Cryobacterium sp.]